MKRFVAALAFLLLPLAAQAAVPTMCLNNEGKPTQCQGVYSTYGSGDTPIAVASGNSANTAISLSLTGIANKTTYITGFHCEWGGATAATEVLLTIASVIGPTTLSYLVIVPAGATLAGPGVSDQFVPPLPANGVNQTITLLVPALGAGNLYAACNARGFAR